MNLNLNLRHDWKRVGDRYECRCLISLTHPADGLCPDAVRDALRAADRAAREDAADICDAVQTVECLLHYEGGCAGAIRATIDRGQG